MKPKLPESKAIELLNILNIDTLPTPVEKILKHFGISLSYDLGDDISGVLIANKNGMAVIGVNPKESHVRQRFTIGHEIGHFVLHRNQSELFVDEHYLVVARDGTIDKFELEANAFSAALLMPENLLKEQISLLSQKKSTEEEKINLLAKKFMVSQIAMTYRLSNLNIL